MPVIGFQALEGKHDFHFLRHGASEGNDKRVAQGLRDYPLTSRGRAQAHAVGAWFLERGTGLVLSSPLARARETAEILASTLGCELRVLPELTELDVGQFEGLTFAVMASRFPAAWRRFQQESWEGVPGAERIEDLLARAGRVWTILFDLARDGCGTPVAVTHSGLLQWLIKVTCGHREWMPLFPMSNCGIFHYQVNNGTLPAGEDAPAPSPIYYAAWRLIDHVVSVDGR